ncbi:MAG: gamma-glutamylcyclotransferase [Candidatus Omnitrophica bacterium]|nr:gamma-glutamylcyclotransferase [Candidatus Omnitrophota bacterium]MCB9720106.1 gamma-glutamylcyclotransferase [Candidatus Omnitrophota bacterium]
MTDPADPHSVARTVLRLFVYGTLKRGYANHQGFCANARHIEEGATWGRLYHLPAGYPALETAGELIIARGTGDPKADARTQHTANGLKFSRPDGDWDLVRGELITFPDPARDLPPIDGLEDFRPDGSGLYQRVLVPVRCGATVLAAWTYVMPCPSNALRLAGGLWPAAAGKTPL